MRRTVPQECHRTCPEANQPEQVAGPGTSTQCSSRPFSAWGSVSDQQDPSVQVLSERINCSYVNEDLSFISTCAILKDQQVSVSVLSDVRLGSKCMSEMQCIYLCVLTVFVCCSCGTGAASTEGKGVKG